VDIKTGSFDYRRLAETVKISIRFLDNVLTANKYPDTRIAEASRFTRKIGLGIMGWADTLIMLGIPYDSQRARCLAYELMGFINAVAEETSKQLADEKGPAPCFKRRKNKFRNGTILSIAPTGSIAIIGDCSNSIEPIFSREYTRKVMDGQLVMSKKYTQDAVRTALEISPMDHLRMQKAFQCWVDSSVAKTVNMPETATVHDVATIYMKAYEMGLKGITIYRQGSRENAPIKCSDGVCKL
jgi:ribonucleoside-diphosphate reductase alpha chain